MVCSVSGGSGGVILAWLLDWELSVHCIDFSPWIKACSFDSIS